MNPSPEKFAAIIIGSGQAGKPLASALAAAGRRTAVVERAEVGGTCVNDGCTPTKTMIASARVAWLARRANEYGVDVGHVAVDLKKVRDRKRSIVDNFRSANERNLSTTDNLSLIRGEASFVNANTLRVTSDNEDRLLQADQIFINTGLRPVKPPITGLDSIPSLDNQSIMELAEPPEHLIVLGGGYVGLEFAQMFRRFGSRVSVIERGKHLLNQEDEDISTAVEQVLEAEGLTLYRTATAEAFDQVDEELRVKLSGPGGKQQTISGSHLLVAAGRHPNTSALNLEAAGIETDDKGFIRTNEKLETNIPGVYALGDVKGGPAFTHVSYNDFLILKANLLDNQNQTINDRPLVYTVFIDPQLGRLGLNERQATAQGRDYQVAKIPMSKVARALETADDRGLIKALVDPNTKEIIGCVVFGLEGGELMSMLQIAMMGQVTYPRLRDGMFAHPLLAESLNTLFASL